MTYRSDYLDLMCVVALIVLLGLALTLPVWAPIRVALSFLFVLLAPGYALSALLFPRRGDVDAVERLVLSLGLSIASLPLMGVTLHYTSLGIQMLPMTLSLGVFTLLALGGAALRRRRLPTQQRFFSGDNLASFWSSLRLLAGTLLLFATVIFTVSALRPPERVTEFYILGTGGKLEAYPTMVGPGQPFNVTLGITNYEKRPMTFSVELPFGAEERLSTKTIESGATWRRSVTLQAPPDADPGRTALTFHLYRNGDREPYRSLQLFVSLVELRPQETAYLRTP